MYQYNNDEDEYEPRITPKPTCKLDHFTVPSVPEVSLIFDKPLISKGADRTGLQTPPVESKDSTHKNNVLSPLHGNGSYAAWKEQNYSCRPMSSEVNNYTPPSGVQSKQNYNMHAYLVENSSRNSFKDLQARKYTVRKDAHEGSQHEEEVCRRTDNYTNKYNYQVSEVNSTPIHKERRNNVRCNKTVRHRDSVSPMQHNPKAYISVDNNILNENDHAISPHDRKLATRSYKQQKVPFNESISEQNEQNMPINANSLQRNEYPLPHYLGGQHPYFNVNAYPFPQLQPYPVQNTENQETVKNLLQIINSQNEQIKSLQIQLDRLLKMQEDNLKERKNCSCSFQLQQQQSSQSHMSSSNTLNTSNNVIAAQNTNHRLCQREQPRDRREYYNENENENRNENELVLTESQSKQKYMEQKVSIGVMTSFEFRVQNSPLTIDNSDYERHVDQQGQENMKLCNGGGFRDGNESLRRYKNSFTRMPSAQLENIVEDSESYMSSSHQQSSNLNASTSIKDLEKQVYVDVRKEGDTRHSESLKTNKDIGTKLNQTEPNTPKLLEGISIGDTRKYGNIRTPAGQRNAVNNQYNVTGNINHETNTPSNMNQYKQKNIFRDTDSQKEYSSLSSTEYENYRKQREFNEAKKNNCIEDSLILNSGDLRINERPPPSPEPSIHVDMQEYSSDDDSEKVKRSSKVGWTFYNNVLGQVNQLLQNSYVIDEQQQNQGKVNANEHENPENKGVIDTVKVATLEQLKKLGISLNENPEARESSNNKMGFDLSFYPRLDYQANMTQATSAVNETNTSMHMKALALKYLTDEQLAELAVQRQGSASVKQLMVSNVQGTNMSFATMRYLERYQLLPGRNNIQSEDIGKIQNEIAPKVDLKLENTRNNPKVPQRIPFTQTPRTTCPSKILDISTLKQQPKLL